MNIDTHLSIGSEFEDTLKTAQEGCKKKHANWNFMFFELISYNGISQKTPTRPKNLKVH